MSDKFFKLFLLIPFPISKWVYTFIRKYIFIDTRRPYFEKTVKHIVKNNIEGDFLEFGVFRGTSFIEFIKLIERYLKNETKKYYAFDTFEGLPFGEGTVWKTNDYLASEKDFKNCLIKNGVDLNKTKIVKGNYLDVLSNELKKNYKLEKASIIHIDCDLYLSTKAVLNFIDDLLVPGSIIIFDEYEMGDDFDGEKRAFKEFKKYKNFEEFYIRGNNKAFILKK